MELKIFVCRNFALIGGSIALRNNYILDYKIVGKKQ